MGKGFEDGTDGARKSEEEGWGESIEVVVLGAGEGCRVVEAEAEAEVEARESSVSEEAVGSSRKGERGRGGGCSRAAEGWEDEGGGRWRDRIVCVMWLCENGRGRFEGSGFEYSTTVSRIALVISSWLV